MRQVICRHPECPPRRNLSLKKACAPEYRESALQGLRRPISGTALHTGRLPEPYRCAGQTRNRLTISYLIITAAQAFFQCTPTATRKFQRLADRTIFQLPPLSISISPQRHCLSSIFAAHLRQHPQLRQHTSNGIQSPATHPPHYFQLPPPTISGPRHRHQRPSSIFSLGVTPAPPPEYTTSGG